MAGPVAAKILLPDDTGNTGPKIRTQTKVVGADTVHEHFFVQARQALILGVYRLGMAQTVGATTAAATNGTSTGMFWFHVPTAVSGKKARIRRFDVSSQHATLLATPTAPRLVVSRMTFTGTASGATVTPVKVDSGYPSPVADIRTAVTGLTVSLVGLLGSAPMVGALTAVGGWSSPINQLIDSSSEDEWWVIAPGEGLAVWQDVAGTTADTRVNNITIMWDEIDTA